MRDAPWRSALAMPEDATVEPQTIVIDAKIFAQPFQGVSPVPQTVRFGEKSVAAEASSRAFLAPPFGIGRTVLSKMRILLTVSVSASERKSDVGDGRRLSTPFGSRGLKFAINHGPMGAGA